MTEKRPFFLKKNGYEVIPIFVSRASVALCVTSIPITISFLSPSYSYSNLGVPFFLKNFTRPHCGTLSIGKIPCVLRTRAG